jgi:predicted small lipoprotein YifL
VTRRALLRLLLLAGAATSLVACGLKGPVEPPPSSPGKFPRDYPKEERPL